MFEQFNITSGETQIGPIRSRYLMSDVNQENDNQILLQDPSQQDFFDKKWLKESGQEIILSNGDIISFIDLMKIGEKDPKREKEILAQIPEEKEDLYREWKIGEIDQRIIRKKEAVNQKGSLLAGLDQEVNQLDTGIASRRQEVNQKTELLNKLENTTKEGVIKAKNLLGDKFPSINTEDSQKIAQEIPELKGVKPEDLGKYTNIITAYYLVQNQDSIASNLDDKTRKEFLNITRELNGAFSEGIKQKLVSYDKKVDSLILGHGTNADDIKVRGSEWIKQGYTDVRYDGNAREFSFRNESGIIKKIQLRGQIAQESVEIRGLSISRSLVPATNKEKELEQRFASYRESVRNIILTSPNTPVTPEIDIVEQGNISNDFDIAKKKHQEGDMLGGLESTRDGLTKKIGFLNEKIKIEENNKDKASNKDTLDSGDVSAMKVKIDKIKGKIEEIGSEINKIMELKKEELELKKDKMPDIFGTHAENTLKTLVSLGYDELGQGVLDRVIRIINLRNKGEVGKIDPTLNIPLTPVQKRELTLAITNMARNARIEKKEQGESQKSDEVESSRQSWQGVDQTDPIIAYRQTQSGLWRETLQSLRGAFQSGGSLERDTSLLKTIYRDTEVPDMTPNIALNTATTNGESQVA